MTSKFGMVQKRALSFLRLCTEIAPKIPATDDSKLIKVVKTFSVLDTLYTKIVGRPSAVAEWAERRGLIEMTNDQFVTVFFDTCLHKNFEVRRISVGDTEVIEANAKGIGTLYFTEYGSFSGGKPDKSATFFYTSDTDFEAVLVYLWQAYSGRLHVALGYGRWGMAEIGFEGFEEPDNPLFGRAKDRLDRLILKHRKYRANKVHRSYLFAGPPGTGKTTSALLVAEQLGDRTMTVDAMSFQSFNAKDIGFLLRNLKPGFLVIDDIDRAPLERAMPTILSLMSKMKSEHPETTIILTANDTSKLDAAFKRPGRIDATIQFPLPNPTERQEILVSYLTQDGIIVPSKEHMRKLVIRTKGLSPSHLREVTLQLRHETVREVLLYLKQFKEVPAPVLAAVSLTPASPANTKIAS